MRLRGSDRLGSALCRSEEPGKRVRNGGRVLGRWQVTTAREHSELIGRPGPSLLGRHYRIVLARHDQEPEVYGTTTLADVEKLCTDAAAKLGLDVDFKQSNHEGQLIDWIHETGAPVKAGQSRSKPVKAGESIGAVFNPGAFTHTSAALHDGIEGASLPVIECHISNVHKREAFRHHSFISPVALGHHRRLRRPWLRPGYPRPAPAVTGRLTGGRLSPAGPRPRRPGRFASPPPGRDDQSSARPARPPGTAARSGR